MCALWGMSVMKIRHILFSVSVLVGLAVLTVLLCSASGPKHFVVFSGAIRPAAPSVKAPVLHGSTVQVSAAVTTWHGARPAAVSLTFDDGRWSAIELGARLLEKHGLRGTFYVVTSRMERRPTAYSRVLQRLAEVGHELGSHTVSHCKLSVPDGNIILPGRLIVNWTDEVLQSAEYLHQTLRRWGIKSEPRSLTFAYPYGAGSHFEEPLKKYLKRIYSAARGLDNDINYSRPDDLFALRSLTWVTRTKPAVIAVWTERAVLHGSLPVEQGFALTRSWLVLTGHGVRPASGHNTIEEGYEPAPEGKLDEYLTSLEKLVQDGLVWADTLGAVVSYIKSRDAVKYVNTSSFSIDKWCKFSQQPPVHNIKLQNLKQFCKAEKMATDKRSLIVRLFLRTNTTSQLFLNARGVTLALTVRFQPFQWTNKQTWRCTTFEETTSCECPKPKHKHQMLWRSTGQLVCIVTNVQQRESLILLQRLQ